MRLQQADGHFSAFIIDDGIREHDLLRVFLIATLLDIDPENSFSRELFVDLGLFFLVFTGKRIAEAEDYLTAGCIAE